LETLVLVDAEVKALAEGVGLALEILGLALDGVDQEDGNGLVVFKC
jgi:hypothetical protein